MSRRKQAKPRACHKLGESTEDADIAVGTENTASVSELLEPKEELLSDAESNADEQDSNSDEHEQEEAQESEAVERANVGDGNSLQPLVKTEPNATNSDSGEQLSNRTELGNNNNNDNNNDNNNSKSTNDGAAEGAFDGVVVDAAAAGEGAGIGGDAAATPQRTSTSMEPPPEQQLDDFDIDDDDGDGDEDVDDLLDGDEEPEDEDLHSLDSFYSDMYSTHTSSSYSPSISDGTLTPNSLPPHPLHLVGLPSHVHERPQDDQTSPSLGPKPTNGNVNSNANANEGAQLEGGTAAESDAKKRLTTQRHTHQQHQQHPHPHHPHAHPHPHRHVEHSLKIAHKLRKIDRESSAAGASASSAAAQKFDKLTGESIKSCRPDGSYQCQFCDKSFPRLGYLKKHEQSHAEHLPFKCDYCARLFKHKRSRDRHTKLHTGDRRYRCPHCEAAFSRSDHLKIHMKTHDNQKPFQCTICNRGYNTAAALTSHMQNHKKQAAILAAGGNPQALNYSPRSTGSASSNGSLNKRRYALAIASDSSPSRLEYPKRVRSNAAAALQLRCSYCPKSVEFSTLEQLNAHVQSAHEKEYQQTQQQLMATTATGEAPACGFQLSCEYCTMKFASIAMLFQHMRSTHIDRLTSPNSYFEHFNRLATSGTFSPRLALAAGIQHQQQQQQQHVDHAPIKLEQASLPSPKVQEPTPKAPQSAQEEEPTDLSQHNKRRSASPQTSPGAMPEKPGVFFCNQCNAGLPDFESFRNHLKTHIAEGMNLVCQHCGMSLQDQPEFERHVIGHFLITSSEYNCAASCSKSYAKSDELQKHLMDQHVITMFKCSLCSELFDSKMAIQVHFACAHTAETKLLRCSACMEVFRSETEFQLHVKTRHHLANNLNNNNNGSIGALSLNSLQCMFCRVVCSSELEMHFHLAAHARQFRCPSCPETFHVEFLLDRHMQSHHSGAGEHGSAEKDAYEEQQSTLSPMNSIYVNALFGGKPPMLPPISAQTNNNNSIIDYNVAFAAAHLQKGLFPPPSAAATNKFYSPLQVDTASAMKQHPAIMYGLSQRYFDTNRALMDMYAAQQEKNYFVSPKTQQQQQQQQQQVVAITSQPDNRGNARDELNRDAVTLPGFSCGMCERNDFRTESEVHSHRKIVHNMKTGVSLRCAYCCANYKSRSELEHHMKTCHNSTGKHKCLICDEVFPSPAILAEHKLQHSKVGQSGKCSHCGKPLPDVAAFKEHLGEHGNNNNESQVPVQCICCRQTLHSDFEISLHAKFHTKSGSSNLQEAACALCLEPLGNGSAVDSPAKVCEKCCRKHNLNARPRKRSTELYERPAAEIAYIENRCNLCKMILPHAHKLQEHLVEHTFAGTEERGYNCYICSAVFTAPTGLLNHMNEHGPNARPYDCNLCTDKFYFRAELDHHLREHELRPLPPRPKEERAATPPPPPMPAVAAIVTSPKTVKQELYESEATEEATEQATTTGNAAADDDEYIEVEQVPELRTEEGSTAARGSNSPLA